MQALKNDGQILGLITGNLKPIAKLKLEAAGIYSFFTVGAYGDDPHKSRSDLILIAIERAGYGSKPKNVYVVGDTSLDIKASLEAGVKNAVGVSNSFQPTSELREAGASVVFDNLVDTDIVLQQLGVGS